MNAADRRYDAALRQYFADVEYAMITQRAVPQQPNRKLSSVWRDRDGNHRVTFRNVDGPLAMYGLIDGRWISKCGHARTYESFPGESER